MCLYLCCMLLIVVSVDRSRTNTWWSQCFGCSGDPGNWGRRVGLLWLVGFQSSWNRCCVHQRFDPQFDVHMLELTWSHVTERHYVHQAWMWHDSQTGASEQFLLSFVCLWYRLVLLTLRSVAIRSLHTGIFIKTKKKSLHNIKRLF